MAFQNHSIPWSTLSSSFLYRPGGNGYNIQHTDIYVRSNAKQTKRMEYFIRKLEHTILEHAEIERKKYRTSEEYTQRASTWTTSLPAGRSGKMRATMPMHQRRQSNEDLIEHESANDANARRIKQTQELRHLQSQLGEGWAFEKETRLIYQEPFLGRYKRYLYCQLNDKSRLVETYTHLAGRLELWPTLSRDEQQQLHRDEFECADVLKLLVLEAATARDERYKEQTTETLLLLAYHPEVKMDRLMSLGMGCCNLHCGVSNLGRFALGLFMYLNLIVALRDFEDQPEVTRPVGGEDETGPNFRPKTRRFDSHLGMSHIKQLSPRPAYMDFCSWQNLVSELARYHENQAETTFFKRALFPRLDEDGDSTDEMPERDPLANADELKRLLTDLWKIIVVTEVFVRSVTGDFDWFRIIVDGLQDMFDRGRGGSRSDAHLMGIPWLDYELMYEEARRKRLEETGLSSA